MVVSNQHDVNARIPVRVWLKGQLEFEDRVSNIPEMEIVKKVSKLTW